MPTILQIAKEQISTAYRSDDTVGLVVVGTQKVERRKLIVWMLDRLAELTSPDPFRALLVSSHYDTLKMVKMGMRYRRWGKSVDDKILPYSKTALRKLHEFNYAPLGVVRELSGELTRKSALDLVVLDQRMPRQMDGFSGMIKRTQPRLTVLLTARELPQGHPWEHFGEHFL